MTISSDNRKARRRMNALRKSASTLVFALAAPMPLFAQAIEDGKETTMPTVVVKDTAETQSQGYQSTVTSVGKMSQPAKDVPQSLTTVTRGLMDDRNADSLKEALRNVAGLTFNAGEGGRIGDNITIRGFTAASDLYLDGTRDNAQYNRETFNLERVEVLRGASSMIFGRGSTGGIVNQVSKEPLLSKRSEIEATGGSYNYERLTADVNQKITESAAFRINALQLTSDSHRDIVQQDRWGIAPSLKWGMGTDNEFLLSYYHLQYDDVPDYGIPIPGVQGGKPIRVPLNTFYGLAEVDYQKDSANIYSGRWTHRFDPATKLNTTLRYNDVARDLRAVAPRIDTGLTTVTRNRQARGAEEGSLTAGTDLTSKFEKLGMKHEGLLGTEFVRETADRWSYFNAMGLANPSTTPFDPNPYDPLPGGYGATYRRINPLDFTSRNIGIYGQDIVEFMPRWKLLAGARLDDFHVDYRSLTTASGDVITYDRDDRVLSWRTGLMYQPTDYVTYYAAYGSAFNPSGDIYAAEATQAARSARTDPEKSVNYELGAKWELMGGDLSLRTALFRTERTNERNTDPAITDLYLLSGKRHTDGIEFEGAGRITPKWEVFGAIAFMTAEIDEHINPFGVGLTPANTPSVSGNLWTTYKVAPAWKIGGGVDFVGERRGYSIGTTLPYTAPIQRHVPGYARLDAMAQWQVVDNTALQLNLFNLLDQRYYDAIYPNGAHAIPGIGRAAQLSVSYKF
jgi:catecholate siderophore receptor